MKTSPHLLLASLVLLSGCSIFDKPARSYTSIRDEFSQAVRADSPAITAPPAARTHYDAVVSSLPNSRINALESRLQPTGWMMRGVSEWRIGRWSEAPATARDGLATPEVSSSPRDFVILSALPGLVIDADLAARLEKSNRQVTLADYERTYDRDFALAVSIVAAARSNAPLGTPGAVLSYLDLQRARILGNWRATLLSIPDQADRRAARAKAAQHLGQPIEDAARAARASAPGGISFAAALDPE